MINYSGLSDAEINLRVASIVFQGCQNITPYSHRSDVQVFHRNECNSFHNYCNNPADAWPIIVESKIGIIPIITNDIVTVNEECWVAMHDCMSFVDYPQDKNPLRAAMIVFLMIKDDVIE